MGWFKELLTGKPKVMPVSIDEDNFEAEVLRSELPVLLDVWGPGCMPCKHLEPIVVELAGRYQGRVKVAELNAQAAGAVAARLGVQGTPTVIYYRPGGEEVERTVGFRGSLYHVEVIEQLLLGEEDDAGDRPGGESGAGAGVERSRGL